MCAEAQLPVAVNLYRSVKILPFAEYQRELTFVKAAGGCNGGNHNSKNNRLSKQQEADYIIARGGLQSAELSKYKREPAGPRLGFARVRSFPCRGFSGAHAITGLLADARSSEGARVVSAGGQDLGTACRAPTDRKRGVSSARCCKGAKRRVAAACSIGAPRVDTSVGSRRPEVATARAAGPRHVFLTVTRRRRADDVSDPYAVLGAARDGAPWTAGRGVG